MAKTNGQTGGNQRNKRKNAQMIITGKLAAQIRHAIYQANERGKRLGKRAGFHRKFYTAKEPLSKRYADSSEND